MELPLGSRKVAPFSLIRLNRLFRSGAYSDFKIRVGSLELRVHRIVLAAASEYFEGLFQSQGREAQEGCLVVTEADPHLFRQLIESVYGEHLLISSFQDQVALLKMLKFYRFYTPMDRLRRFLSSMEVPADGMNEYISLLEYMFDELTPDTIELIVKQIRPSSQLVDLSDQLLHLILGSKQFPWNNFPDELQIFQFIHRLVLLDHTPELYRYVKLTNLTEDQRRQLLAQDKLSPELLDRYLEASVRFPLTENLHRYLLERFQDESNLSLEPITVAVSKEHHLLSNSSIGALVRGDGDQTPVQVLFGKTSPIVEGDIIEILDYTLITTGKGNHPFCVYANRWKRVS